MLREKCVDGARLQGGNTAESDGGGWGAGGGGDLRGHMHLGFLSPGILQGVLQLVQRSAGRVETGGWHRRLWKASMKVHKCPGTNLYLCVST